MKANQSIVLLGRTVALLYLCFWVLIGCQPSTTPSEDQSVNLYKAPESKAFTLPSMQPFQWDHLAPDSAYHSTVLPLDVEKRPYVSFSSNSFEPLKKPMEEGSLILDDLPKVPFSLDTVGQKIPLKVRKFLLPKPSITQALGPTHLNKGTAAMTKFSTEEGLPSNVVHSMVQDLDGFKWVANAKGLTKYVGDEFITYDFFEKELNGDTERLLDLSIDQQGRILIAGYLSGIYRLDPKTSVVEHFQIREKVVRIFLDQQGMVWLSSLNRGLFLADFDNRELYKVDFLDDKPVFSVFIDSKKNLWVGMENQIAVVDSNRTSARLINIDHEHLKGFHFQFFEDSSGKIWTSSSMLGSLSFDLQNQKGYYLGPEQGYYGVTLDLFEDHKQRIWLISNDTLTIFDPQLDQLKKSVFSERLIYDGSITSGLIDDEGVIWIGTTGGIILSHSRGLLADYFTDTEGLSDVNVWGINEDSKNRIWLSTYNGIHIYDPKLHRLSKLTLPKEWSKNSFRDISKLQEDLLFVGGERSFSLVDVKRNTIEIFNSVLKTKVNTYFQAVQTANGEYWIASGDGMLVFDARKHTWKRLNQSNGLINNLILICFLDRKGRVWALSQNGLSIIDPDKNALLNLNTKDGLLDDNNSMINQDTDGSIQIVTKMGIQIFNEELTEITFINQEQGLIPSELYDIIQVNGQLYLGSLNGLILTQRPDSSGRNWNFYNFNRNSGLPFGDYNQAVAFHSSKGDIWWSATPIVTVVHQQPDIKHLKRKVSIKKIHVMNQTGHFGDHKQLLKSLAPDDTLWIGNQAYTPSRVPVDSGYFARNGYSWDSVRTGSFLPLGLKMPHHQNSFSFSFNSPTVLARDQLLYRYKLVGVDNQWSSSSKRTVSKVYYNVPPGTYTYQVAVGDYDGKWSEPDSFTFTILPPWWQTWWIRSIIMVLLVGLIYLIVKLRSRWLEKENRILEQKVHARTIELHEKMTELKSTQAQLIQSEKMASLGELTAGIAHEIQNPLNFVNNFSEVSMELVDEIMDEQKKPQDQMDSSLLGELLTDIKDNLSKIMHHGKRADSIVKGMLQHSRSHSGTKEPTSLNVLVDEYLRLAYHGLRAKDKTFNAQLITDYDPLITQINIVGQDISRVVLNLITNALYAVNQKKLQQQGYEPTVSVKTRKDQDRVWIAIEDNGTGIPSKVIDKIFNPFFTTKPTGHGTGLGLSMAYDIIKAHGGELTVDTTEGEGTTFTISLPLT
jgi:signal transduction histidine kinase/ligand-binding sensor domain-containing protein